MRGGNSGRPVPKWWVGFGNEGHPERDTFDGRGDRWWTSDDDRQTPNQLHRNWPAIQRHPRLVWDGTDETLRLALRYLDNGRPFSVYVP